MADVFTNKASIDAAAMELVHSIVQDELIQRTIILPTIRDMSALAVPGLDTIKIPRLGSFVSESKTADTAMSAQALTTATDDLLLDKHEGVQALVEDIAALQANFPLLEEYLRRFASAIALKVDETIYAEMKDNVSTANPDHKIDWDNAGTDTVTKADFISAKRLLKEANAPISAPDMFALINPQREGEMLALADFVDADKWIEGSRDAKLNGMIGRVYGFNVLVSNVVNDDEVLFYNRATAAYATQQAPKLESQRALEFLSDRLSLSILYGVKTLQQGQLIVLVGTA